MTQHTRNGNNVNGYLILRRNDEVLLGLRHNTGYLDGHYGLVSGHVEAGESGLAGLLREAHEEANLRLTRDQIRFAHCLHRRTDRLNIDLFFECHEWNGEIENREPHKCKELRWFSLADLPSNTIGYVRDVLTSIAQGICYSESGWEPNR